jgi:APA family basic amino acid/polyamine antiporter
MANIDDETKGANGPGLARRLGLATATALVVGEVIGVGIFLTPAEMAKSLGSPAWLMAVWLTMGGSASGGALCFGGLAARFPEAGGLYVYLREAYGPRPAFLFGWLSMLVTDPGLTAMLAIGMAEHVAHLAPISGWGVKGVAVGTIVGLAVVNMGGTAIGSGVLRGLAGLKLGLLGVLVVWGVGSGCGDWSNLSPFWTRRPGSGPLSQALASGLVLAFISFAGWWDASKIAGEVRDPQRTMPRALVLGVSIVTVVYIAVSMVFLYLVGPGPVATSQDRAAFAALAGRALFGRTGEVVFAAVVVATVAGSLAAVLMASPRVYYAMARDGVFFAGFAVVDPRRGVPARAVAIQAGLASVLALTGTFDQVLNYFMVPTLAFLAMTLAGVFILRGSSKSRSSLISLAGPGLIVPGHPITTLAALVPILAVIVLQSLRDPVRAAIGIAVVLLGVPAFALVRTRPRPAGERISPARGRDEISSPSTQTTRL